MFAVADDCDNIMEPEGSDQRSKNAESSNSVSLDRFEDIIPH